MVWAILNDQVRAALAEVLKSKSDRIVAVVGCAIVDEVLFRALEWRMPPGGVRDSMFKPDRPLGSFNSRYNLAYLLNMVDMPTRDAMSAMGKVRNVFAHNLDITFASNNEELQKGLNTLRLHERYSLYPHPSFYEDAKERVKTLLTPRARFITNMRILMGLLMRDFNAHQPNSNIPQSLPKQPMSQDAIGPLPLREQFPSRDKPARPKSPRKKNKSQTP